MKWHAECCVCQFSILSDSRKTVRKLAKQHKQKSQHDVIITGELAAQEVKRCEQSGISFVVAVGEIF
ncbi:MAG: hypothetical protein FH749_07975 [Firmicutes bacterium]|nr:hypothetical protein [Bacillota bacterium]